MNVKLYYINLDKSRNRRNYIEKHFNQFTKKTGYPLSRIPAVSRSTFDDKLSSGCINRNNKTEVAVLLSHLKAIHTAYHDKVDFAYIFEDDVVIHRIPDTKKITTSAPRGWEIIQLFTTKFYYGGNQLFKRVKSITACAYLINRIGMRRILLRMSKNGVCQSNFNAVDWRLRGSCVSDVVLYRHLNGYLYTDLYFSVKTDDSTIHPSHLAEQKYDVKKILDYFRAHGYKK